MVGVMSLWTGTSAFKLTRGAALIHSLAICKANEAFPCTELVTDSKGLEIADRLGWRYTSFINALDDIAPEGMRHIWALGKLRAIKMQEAPFCHLDNDVILHKPLPEWMQKAQVFAQSKDIPAYYQSHDMKRALEVSGLPNTGVAYNVGIFGGNSMNLLQNYARRALELANKFNGCDINGTTTSMVVEQYFLGFFAREVRVRVEELIPILFTPSDLEDAGYSHLVGNSKRNQFWVDKCEKRLSANYPSAYSAFLKGWKVVQGRL